MAKDTWNRLNGKDFYNGIGLNSATGMGEMRNVMVDREPGIIMLNRELRLGCPQEQSGVTFTADAGTDEITVASGSFSWGDGNADGTGRPVQLTTTGTLPGGLSTSTTYWIYHTGNETTFTLHGRYEYGIDGTNALDILDTGTGTHTITPIDPGRIEAFCIDDENDNYYFADDNDNIWRMDADYTQPAVLNAPELMPGRTGTNYRALAVWKGYLFAIGINGSNNAAIDVCNLGSLGNITSANWDNDWESGTLENYSTSAQNSNRDIIIGQDDTVYITNKDSIASIIEVVDQTFDPDTGATYTVNADALVLPDGKIARKLAELGKNLMIACNDGYLYPWDRVSDQPELPLIYPTTIDLIINVNNRLYTFHSAATSIYVADSVTHKFLKRIPEYITNRNIGGNTSNLFGKNVARLENKLVFGMNSYEHSGVWSLNLDNNALCFDATVSTGNVGDSADPVIIDFVGTLTGVPNKMFVARYDDADTTKAAVDVLTNGAYASLGIVDTPVMAIGDAHNPTTIKEVEVHLDRALSTSSQYPESLKLSYRKDGDNSWTDLATYAGNGGIYEGKTVYNWKVGITSTDIQFRVSMIAGTLATDNSTGIRIKEIRFR